MLQVCRSGASRSSVVERFVVDLLSLITEVFDTTRIVCSQTNAIRIERPNNSQTYVFVQDNIVGAITLVTHRVAAYVSSSVVEHLLHKAVDPVLD